MTQVYFALLTAVGEAKLANAVSLGTTLQLSKMAVGDGNGATTIPNRNQTALVKEQRRAPLNRLSVDPLNASQIIAEQVIPEDIGGWWIREIGLYDAAGDLCAVANCPDTYKPVLSSGSGRTQIIRMVLVVSSTTAVELKIDPSVVLATRAYADNLLAVHATAADPHPQYATDADLAAHAAAADPHPIYLTSAEGDVKIAAAVAALVNSSPAALDTLKELATALGNDPNFAATITNSLAGKADKATTLAGYGIVNALQKFTTGQALPATNIGPIWHDDYNSVMTWQSFTNNGANYVGYASVLIGSLLLDTQSTPRTGYIKTGVTNLSRTAYAALRAWAQHNGVMVASGSWVASNIMVADNADGTTFRIYDIRGEFPRIWADGGSVDSARVHGAYQNAMIPDHLHPTVPSFSTLGAPGNAVNVQTGFSSNTGGVNSITGGVTSLGNENRPRNVALLGAVKF